MKDLKTSIYRFIVYSVLILSTLGCEAEYEMETYPTLSGSYKVEFISATGQNLITGQVIDTMIVAGSFSMKDPIEPFDILDIGERIHFTNSNVYGGYYLSNLGDEWEYNFHYYVHRDLITGAYRRIEIDYFNTKRVFTIVADGVDYLILSSSGQWEDGSPEKTFTKFTVHLERIGP